MIQALVLLVRIVPALAIFSFFKGSDESIPVVYVNGVRGIIESQSAQFGGSHFVCDGGKTLPFSAVNDDFCDCLDGTDEPGTSACASGKFSCINKGYLSVPISSSKVDDGVCDCCDGSDEGNVVQCSNTCDAVAKKQREQIEKIASAYRAGSVIRSEYLTSAASKYNSLKEEEKVLAEQKSILQAIVENEEIVERGEESSKKVELASRVVNQLLGKPITIDTIAKSFVFTAEESSFSAVTIQMMLDSNDYEYFDEINAWPADQGVGSEGVIMPQWLAELNDNDRSICLSVSNMFKTRLMVPLCRFAWKISRAGDVVNWIGMLGEATAKLFIRSGKIIEFQYAMLYHASNAGVAVTVNGEIDENVVPPEISEFVVVRKYNTKEACMTEFANLISLCDFMDLKPEFDLYYEDGEYIYKRPEAVSARNSLSDVEKKIRNLNAQKFSSLYESNLNFQPYFALSKECIEIDEGKFVYKVCMFDSVSQKESNGHSWTNLGSFQSIRDAQEGDFDAIMSFEHGAHCHAHGARKADVKLLCGPANAIIEAREPAICSYSLIMETPAACTVKYAQSKGIA